jgi:type I restriction-modification system DNA methylase subunit
VGTSTAIGFESKLWAAADALRNNMDAAEYAQVVHHQAAGLVLEDAVQFRPLK